MQYCEGDLQNMKRQIKRLFAEYKKNEVGQYAFRSDSVRNNRAFLRAAEICLEEDIDPDEFVRANIHSVPNAYPNVLSNKATALKRHREYVAEFSEGGRVDIYVNSQLDSVMGRAQAGWDIVRILTDPNENLCPAIRYVLLGILGFEEAAEKYKDRAVEYSRTHPVVRDAIKSRFPGVSACQEL